MSENKSLSITKMRDGSTFEHARDQFRIESFMSADKTQIDRWQASELDTNVSTIVLMPTLQSCAVLWNMAKLGALEKLTTPTHADKALLHGRSFTHSNALSFSGSCGDPPRTASETHLAV